MTAICGFLYQNGTRDSAAACARMHEALAMYGPDDKGQWDGGQTSLGIRKYHTLPEDIYDTQPLNDGRYVMVADIRLDNRPELAAEFGWPEAETVRRADADFALAAWQKWGEACLDKLIGDWALAVWDREEKTLTLARDMVGMRPLLWHQGKDKNGTPYFAFSSMTQGLFALPGIQMAPDTEVLKFYLALAPMRGDGWFFRDIHRVLPGGVTHLKADGSTEVREWYNWDRLREVPVKDDEACVREFRALFDRAVKDRLRSIGGVACHLSSGFDSSAVTTTAAGLLAKENKRLAAYTHVPHKGWQTYVAKGRLADEGDIAARTAATYPNIDHYRIDSGEKGIGEDLAANFYYAQFPALNMCNTVWTEEIKRIAAKNGATVLLSGAMGNMTISQVGMEKLYDDFSHGRILTWLRDIWEQRRQKNARIRGSLYYTFGHLMPAHLMNLLRRLNGSPIYKLKKNSVLKKEIATTPGFKKAMKARGFDPYYRPKTSVREVAKFVMRRLDIRDAINLAALARYGIDERDPTSDRRLLEFSLSLPPRMWLRHGKYKWLYGQAFRGRVPDEVIAGHVNGQQGGDWPERMRKSWDQLKIELSAALEDPTVQALIDTDFYREIMEKPFPDKINQTTMIRYRIKFLRGLSVAHFIRKANMRN